MKTIEMSEEHLFLLLATYFADSVVFEELVENGATGGQASKVFEDGMNYREYVLLAHLKERGIRRRFFSFFEQLLPELAKIMTAEFIDKCLDDYFENNQSAEDSIAFDDALSKANKNHMPVDFHNNNSELKN